MSSHYKQRLKYYLMVGEPGDHNLASEEELHLSRKLFWSVFKALNKKVNYINIFLHTDHLKMSCLCNLTMHSKHVFFKSSSKSVSQGMCLIFSCWSFSPCKKKNVLKGVTHLRFFSLHGYLSQLLCLTDLEHQRFQFIDQICSQQHQICNMGFCLHIHIPEHWDTSPPIECNSSIQVCVCVWVCVSQ